MADTNIKHSKANIYDFFFSNKKRATYTNLGISLVLIIVFILFALRPTIVTIGNIKSKIEQYQTVNRNAESKIKAAKNLQSQINTSSDEVSGGLKDEIDYVNKVFQESLSLKSIYTNLIKRAEIHNVVVRNITPNYPNGEISSVTNFDVSEFSPSQASYTLNFTIEAKDFISIENYIKSLEGYQNFPLLSRIHSINITDEFESAKISEDTTVDNKKISQLVVANIQMVIYLDETRYEPEETMN